MLTLGVAMNLEMRLANFNSRHLHVIIFYFALSMSFFSGMNCTQTTHQNFKLYRAVVKTKLRDERGRIID